MFKNISSFRGLFAPEGPSGGGAPSGGGTPSTPSAPSGGTGTPSTPSSTPSGASPSTPPSAGPSTPEPAATPSPGDKSTPSQEGHDNTLGDGLFDFPEPSENLDDDKPSVDTQPKSTKPEGQEAVEAAPAAPEGVEPPAQPPVATPTPPQPQPAPGPTEASPPLSLAEPGKIAEAMLANSEQVIAHLAQTEFALSKEDVEALEADAPKALQTMAARAYFKAQVNMMNQMSRVVPHMIQKQMTIMKRNMDNENKFYGKWKDLDPSAHGELVRKYAQLYRQANPEATLDKMIEDVGPIVMQVGKVVPKVAVAGGNGAVRRPSPPFKPGLGGPAAPPPILAEEPWAGLAPSAGDTEE